jgi:hypothetical protein
VVSFLFVYAPQTEKKGRRGLIQDQIDFTAYQVETNIEPV